MLKEAVASHAGEGKCLCDLLVGGRYFDDAGATLATLGLEPNTGMTPVEAVVQKLVEPGTYECAPRMHDAVKTDLPSLYSLFWVACDDFASHVFVTNIS
eukprot:s2170_g5.t1